LLNLISPAEDVGVILLEAANSGKPGERATNLIPMQHTEISESDRHFLVGMSLVFENQAMPRAIHGLQPESLSMRLGAMLMATICILAMIMSFNHEEIFLVVFVVSRNLPQVNVEHIRCDNLLIAPPDVFSSHQINQAVIDLCAMRQKESTPRCKLVEEKQVLVLSNHPMIPLQGFLFKILVFFKLGFFWEGNSVNSLELVFGGITKPVGS